MRIALILILLIMVLFNLWCFYKSRKYLNKADMENQENDRSYEIGLKYIKISVIISVIICLTGAAAVVLVNIM